MRRRSRESSVTIPFERTYRNLDKTRPAPGSQDEKDFTFCGCGWPENMLVPKGTPDGLLSELFVMISNYEEDRVRLSQVLFLHQSHNIHLILINTFRLNKLSLEIVMMLHHIVVFVTAYIQI